MDVHLRALRYFVAVADELRRLQSGCSCRSRRCPDRSAVFEQELRIDLFERDQRTTTLTALGRRSCRTCRSSHALGVTS